MKYGRSSGSTARTLLIAFLLASPLCGAEVYKWTDENGVTHYSDSPPPEGQESSVQDISTEPENSGIGMPVDVNPENPGTTPAELSAADLKRQQIAESREKMQEQQANMSRLCSEARSKVNELEPNRRVYYTNEDGETVRMDDQERVDAVAELKAYLRENCS